MQPLVSIETHNHIALVSITIAPVTFLAALTFTFVFLYTYLISIGHIPLRNIIPTHFPRLTFRKATVPVVSRQPAIEAPPRKLKALPALPAPESHSGANGDLGKSLARLTEQTPTHPLSLFQFKFKLEFNLTLQSNYKQDRESL
ncbi:hypothetical protein M426DRAFT_14074 [Hypoxylon sp. CI-4A]|nr:hypothetical protein M426DRAFT_14074 [Hypoxylon sp. CI-4A]